MHIFHICISWIRCKSVCMFGSMDVWMDVWMHADINYRNIIYIYIYIYIMYIYIYVYCCSSEDTKSFFNYMRIP